jgi:hypothetical protein
MAQSIAAPLSVARHRALTRAVFALSLSIFLMVRMLVAPTPVVILVSASLLIVFAISLMPFAQIASVSVVFAVIPIVVVLVMPVVHTDGDVFFLRLRFGHNQSRRNNGGGQ